jgi:hypothetical protein
MDDRCPICKNPVERRRDGDYDKKQVLCSRCGPFEISGTALAMLESRVHHDPLVSARLSHAIRSRTSQEKWFFVSSVNLDELIQNPLPGIPQQVQNLALWLKARLSDDRLGRVRCPSLETLAGVIGAIDGKRVEKLVDHAVNERIVERGPEMDLLGLSPKGWTMVEPATVRAASKPEPANPEPSSQVVKAHCNECGGERKAHKRASHTLNGNDGESSWSNTYEVLECCGCSNMSVRHTFWFSEWDQFESDPLTGQPRLVPGIKETYWPPPTKRRKPEWAEIRCPACNGWIDCRDLAQVFEHEGPLPHPATRSQVTSCSAMPAPWGSRGSSASARARHIAPADRAIAATIPIRRLCALRSYVQNGSWRRGTHHAHYRPWFWDR